MTIGRRGQELITASDGLPALEVAAHAKEKEFVLRRITEIFNGGMKNKWDCRYYLDLFTGPGLCRIRGTTTEIDGSATLAVKSKFTDYFLADDNADSLAALQQRMSGLEPADEINARYYNGNADSTAKRILKDLPPARSSLGLAVFDPWGWDFSFETLANISESRRLDLVVNFPIGYIKRNWEKELPMLDKFMNGNGYREPFRAAMRREAPGESPARVLLDAYKRQLQSIGYQYIRDHVIVPNSKNLTLYCLVFASKNERGTDFWDKVTDKKQSGQFRMAL